MARSIWKGPFVDGYLLKKAETSRASGRSEVIKIWSRRSTILPQFVGLTFGVHNGQKHVPVNVSRGHDRSQVRRILADADLPWPRGGQEGEEGLSECRKQANPPRARGQRGEGGRAHDPRVAAEAQSSRPAHPRQEGRSRARRSGVLAQAHRARREEDAGKRHRQRREQSRPRRRRSDRRRRPSSARRWS